VNAVDESGIGASTPSAARKHRTGSAGLDVPHPPEAPAGNEDASFVEKSNTVKLLRLFDEMQTLPTSEISEDDLALLDHEQFLTPLESEGGDAADDADDEREWIEIEP